MKERRSLLSSKLQPKIETTKKTDIGESPARWGQKTNRGGPEEKRPTMRIVTYILAAVFTVSASAAAAAPPQDGGKDPGPYTDAQIAAAIEFGYNHGDDLDDIQHSCTAAVGGLWNRLAESLETGEGQPLRKWRIHGQPPLARIAQEADFAARRYTGKPSVDDVRHLIGDNQFTVWAEPDTEGDMRTAANLRATRIGTVVGRARGDREGRNVIQPLSVEIMDGSVTSNLHGASVEIFGVMATFDSEAVQAIIAEKDFEVLVITDSREEFKCNLDDTRLKRGYNP